MVEYHLSTIFKVGQRLVICHHVSLFDVSTVYSFRATCEHTGLDLSEQTMKRFRVGKETRQRKAAPCWPCCPRFTSKVPGILYES